MDASTFITIITALAALIGAASPIVVSLIQSKKDKSQEPKGIYVVGTYRPKTQIRWFVVLSFALLGGIVGYSAAKFANTNPSSVIANPISTNTSIPKITFIPTDTGELMSTPTNFSTSVPTMVAQANSATSNSVLFEEDFEDGKAQGISYIKGNWNVVKDNDNNRVYEIDNTGDSSFPGIGFGSTTWKNYTIEYRFKLLSENAWVILEFRRNLDASDKYILDVKPEYPLLILEYALNGSSYQQLVAREVSFATGVWYAVRVDIHDTEIKVAINNDTKIDTTDSRIGAGNLYLSVGPGTHAQFDDIRVTALGK